MEREIKCPDCDGGGAKLEMVMTQGCCRRPREDGSCCGVGEPNWEPEQVQCAKCRATGLIENPDLTDEWKRYYEDLKEHEARCEREKPLKEDMEFCHPDNGSFMEGKFNSAYSQWQMMCSCDAPNKPGYYRANND